MKETEKEKKAKQYFGPDSDWNIRPYLAVGLIFFIVFCCCILVVCILFRFEAIKNGINIFLSIAQPIIVGLALGYLLNPVMMFFERFLLKAVDARGGKNKFRRLIRTVSSILAVLVFILIIATLLSMVIPQVSANIMSLMDNLPGQINTLIRNMNEWQFGSHEITNMIETNLMTLVEFMEDWLKNSLLPQTKDYVTSVTNGVINILVAFKNVVIGLIVSIYAMCEKENLKVSPKRSYLRSFRRVPQIR